MLADGIARHIRGAQVRAPWLFGAKNVAQRGARRLLRRPFEPDFNALAALDLPPDGLVFDVGGNRGQSIDAVRLFLPKARIVSFEPNPHLADGLRKLYAADERVSVRNVALSDEATVLVLHVPCYNGWMFDGLASLDRNEAETFLSDRNLYGFKPEKLEIVAVECRAETLDSFGGDGVVFIKIDVQGLEQAVLDGSRGTIERNRPVIMLETNDGVDVLDHLPVGYQPAHWNGRRLARGLGETINMFYLPEDVARRL